MNTHGVPDTMAEIMAREEDLLPACVVSTTFPTVPVSSMTLAAFPTHGYVRDGAHLVYAEQAAVTLPLAGSDGTYWLALARNVSTTYAGWSRRAGSLYLWLFAASRPPDSDGLLVFASCTVAGGIITAVTPAPGVTRAEAWRTLGGLGTMAVQNASAVAITGGTATGLTALSATGPSDLLGMVGIGAGGIPGYVLRVATGKTLLSSGSSLGINVDPISALHVFGESNVDYARNTQVGVKFRQLIADTGGGAACGFYNVAQALIGTITTTATATAYNTSSDARLKEEIEDLPNPLQVIAALRPVRFRWKSTGRVARGLLANEAQAVVPDAVSGEVDAVDADGRIIPQQIDYSKFVPDLLGAVKALIALNTVRGNQIQALTARVAALEAAQPS